MTEPERSYCKVYWGTHGCDLARGHDGPHVCECNSVCPAPDPFVVIYGEDAPDQGIRIEDAPNTGPFWR